MSGQTVSQSVLPRICKNSVGKTFFVPLRTGELTLRTLISPTYSHNKDLLKLKEEIVDHIAKNGTRRKEK